MFDEIDNLQSEISKLNQLCAESLGKPFEGETDSITSRRRERLGIFILKLLDGILEPRYTARLEKWLISDSAARQYYVDFMKLTALLRVYYNPERFKSPTLTETAKL